MTIFNVNLVRGLISHITTAIQYYFDKLSKNAITMLISKIFLLIQKLA